MRAFRSPLLLYVATVALTFLACDAASPDGGSEHFVQVHVTNTSHAPVRGAVVTIDGTQVALDLSTGTTQPLLVGAGSRTVTVSAPGYTPYSNSFDINGATTLEVEIRGTSQVSGQIVNSQDGQGIAGARIVFSRNGYPELADVTGATGTFNFVDAPSGTFTVEITRTGFITFLRENVEITNGAFVLDPVAITETPPAGSFRIILTWGATPSDLDTHLTGPDGAGGRFHVYYGNRSAGGSTLDLDDTSGNGPETTTITTLHNGVYRFSALNFSNQTATGAQGIAASPARIEVYSSFGLIKSYTAPPATAGNTWRVFEMNVSEGVLQGFTDNDGASLGYVTAAGSTDTGTFLTGGGDAPAEEKRPSI